VADHSEPRPTPNDSAPIVELVLLDVTDPLVRADLVARSEIGLERYGVLLQAHNGRDALRDAYEEALDLVMYLRQAVEEASNVAARHFPHVIYEGALALACGLRHLVADRQPGPAPGVLR